MSMPTLTELRQMAGQLKQLEHQAQQADERAAQLRKCGGHKHIADWLYRRVSTYRDQDYDGLTKLLEDALVEFGPAILEAMARRQELAAHEAMTAAVMKRAELATFVTLEPAKSGSAA